MKHTDLPWKVTSNDIRSNKNELLGCAYGFVQENNISKHTKETYANAQFIVRACNNHYDLLEALKQSEVEVNKWHSFLVANNDKQNKNNAWGCLKKIQKAISKAVGK